MASHFARSGFARFKSPTSRLFLGVSGSLGLVYYASTFKKVYADSSVQSSDTPKFYPWRRFEGIQSNPEKGVRDVHHVSWPANLPCEDVIASKYVAPMAWSFWSVYDGHVGPQTARHLDRHLLPNLVGSLSILYSTVGQPETETIHSTIKRVFLSLDDEIVTKSVRHLVEKDAAGAPIRTMAALVLQAARAGSCALVAFYDANVRRLHVSCVGDSRAVLGRRCTTDDGRAVYDVHVLSADQTGHNPAEIARLTAEHPGEDKLFVRGRLLNWGPSRTFGNGVMKWSRELQTWMKEKCLGDKPYNDLLTPPYFTAEPEITTTAVEPGDFLVMASDGLWDCLTNEEVVGLVGVWLEANNGGAKAKGRAGTVIERTDLPVELIDKKTHYPTWKVQKRFVNVDANAARHLAHNALGGADEDLHRALMITPAPRARHFRDDVSAIVVFFE